MLYRKPPSITTFGFNRQLIQLLKLGIYEAHITDLGIICDSFTQTKNLPKSQITEEVLGPGKFKFMGWICSNLSLLLEK